MNKDTFNPVNYLVSGCIKLQYSGYRFVILHDYMLTDHYVMGSEVAEGGQDNVATLALKVAIVGKTNLK